MTDWQLIALAVAIVAGHKFVARRLLDMTQPLKLRLAGEIERLAADPRMPKRDREGLAHIPALFFSQRAAWAIVILIPTYAARDVLLSLIGVSANGDARNGIPAELRGELAWVVRRSAFCILSNSPLAALIAAMLAPLMAVFLYVPLDRVARKVVKTMGGHAGGADDLHRAA